MKKRIAFVVNTLSGGGAERTVANLSRILSEYFNIDIIVNDDVHLEYPYKGQVFSLKMPAGSNIMGTVYQIKALVRRVRLLKKLKNERDYVAVLSFSEMTNLANVLSGRGKRGNIKRIISIHNSVKNSKASGWKYRLIVKYIFPFCIGHSERTVACSKEITDELVKDYGLKIDNSYTVYNGIDLERIKKNASIRLNEPLHKDKERIIITVGRLARQKGQWHLIRAVKKLRDDGLPVKLLILGEGELRNTLQKMIIAGGLENDVFLSGFVSNPQQYIAEADVVVFPSLYEGFSNAIAEALACGVAVISTDHETGAREILAPQTNYHVKVKNRIEKAEYGILTPVCDGKNRGVNEHLSNEEKLMAEAIRKVITDPKLNTHYRYAALKRARQLDIRTIASEWIRVIEDL